MKIRLKGIYRGNEILSGILGSDFTGDFFKVVQIRKNDHYISYKVKCSRGNTFELRSNVNNM